MVPNFVLAHSNPRINSRMASTDPYSNGFFKSALTSQM